MKEIIMEVTAPFLLTGEDGVMRIPEGWKQEYTEDDVGYLIKECEEEVKINDTDLD